MTTSPIIQPVEVAVSVPLAPEKAYAALVGGFGRWWPREFTWSGADHLVDTGIVDEAGGAAWEIGARGVRWDFGVVLVHEPPVRIALSWQIGPDRVPVPHPDEASVVELTLTAVDAATRVHLRHHRFEVHGELGAAYRDQMEQAWPYALDAFVTAVTP
ncbi:SRPBCC domain-containing protein [Aeromicrobium sp. CF4.19]|uniref:SRPBCC domain-containing protein n=1 Tax=Aeromicrobium sp. CF4.19 TaxID=3373082 RepID=UPI003EE6D573